jgi:hypothetical protein
MVVAAAGAIGAVATWIAAWPGVNEWIRYITTGICVG